MEGVLSQVEALVYCSIFFLIALRKKRSLYIIIGMSYGCWFVQMYQQLLEKSLSLHIFRSYFFLCNMNHATRFYGHLLFWSFVRAKHQWQILTAMFIQHTEGGVINLSVKRSSNTEKVVRGCKGHFYAHILYSIETTNPKNIDFSFSFFVLLLSLIDFFY